MSKKIAQIISLILNPLVLLLPVPFFLVYEKTGKLIPSLHWGLLSIFFICLYFLLVLSGVKYGIFSDLDISKREQRPVLFLVGIFLTISYLVILFLFHAPEILIVGSFALILGLIILGAINMFTKASGHLAVLSAFLTFAVLVEGWRFLGGFILLPLLVWARIKTKNHTLTQTILGSIIGILTTAAIYVIVKYIVR